MSLRSRLRHAPTSIRPAAAPILDTPIWRACARSDPARFFGDRIDLMLEELELSPDGRDLPGELFVLGEELLEEGDYAFDVMVGFHVSEHGACRKDLPTAARERQEGAD